MSGEDAGGLTNALKKNIVGSTFFKGIDVVFNFLLVRFAIQFFGQEDYGIWLTILSFFTWFSVVEYGISSSFRNKLTKFFADGKWNDSKKWISRGYQASVVIYLLVILSVIILFSIFDFELLTSNLGWIFQLSFVLYCVHYVFFFLQTVLLATHHASAVYFVTALQKGILLVGIICFGFFELNPSLTFICLWFSSVPLLVWGIVSWVSYRTFLNKLRPNLGGILDLKTFSLKDINGAFFVMQMATLLIYATDNFIIMDQLSGTDVTIYNVTFKYFNILIIIFNIVLLPYWSSFTEAMHLKNFQWIERNIRKLILFWLLMVALGIGLYILCDLAYAFWIGSDLQIPTSLSLFMGLSIILTCWNTIFSYFLNSISKTRIQLYLLVFGAVINLPLSYYLLELYGTTGVIIATSCVLLPLSIILPLQVWKILRTNQAAE